MVRRAALGLGVAACAVLAAASNASAQWNYGWGTAPVMGNLSGVTLNGQAQTTTTTWNLTSNYFSVVTSGPPDKGWNITVNGQSGSGMSAVFKQYCPNTSCGSDSGGPGYIGAGYSLPADSLTINTTSAGWTTGGTTPTYQCNSGCYVDNANPTEIVSASSSVGYGTWQTSGSATLSLATPSTLRKLQANEVYQVNLLWSLNSGP